MLWFRTRKKDASRTTDEIWIRLLLLLVNNTVKVTQSCPTLGDPYIVHGILQTRIVEWIAFPFSRDLPNPGIKPRSPTLQMDSLPAEPQGKPKNTGVGSLSLLQQIFLTQESNWGLLHCRRILSQYISMLISWFWSF